MPLYINKAFESKSLNDIAEYIYILTSNYNKFYQEHRVLTEEDIDLKESWLVLSNIVYNASMLLLDLMGINVPEKM